MPIKEIIYPHVMFYLYYLCLFTYSGVQHILCCVFALFIFVLLPVFALFIVVLCCVFALFIFVLLPVLCCVFALFIFVLLPVFALFIFVLLPVFALFIFVLLSVFALFIFVLLTVSLDYPFMIAPFVFFIVYLAKQKLYSVIQCFYDDHIYTILVNAQFKWFLRRFRMQIVNKCYFMVRQVVRKSNITIRQMS